MFLSNITFTIVVFNICLDAIQLQIYKKLTLRNFRHFMYFSFSAKIFVQKEANSSTIACHQQLYNKGS